MSITNALSPDISVLHILVDFSSIEIFILVKENELSTMFASLLPSSLTVASPLLSCLSDEFCFGGREKKVESPYAASYSFCLRCKMTYFSGCFRI